MTTYGINQTVFERLMAYFQSEEEIRRVILFGSRAKGTARYNSDIDLCIDYIGKQKWKVIDAIDEIVGIYSFDVLFADSLNKEIAQQIKRDGIVIYER
ncbi:nucleotidyltransferase domain-containing protein [Anoxybacillus flavithermus]|uniref:Nucleotidyltransferase domain-containing protein n=1 Tax=Anoxybacillus flavithermus TaxID=33934 RepID=A0AAX1ZZP0_9BACL|nr:nucleotidyltransferase domain-containing protein [Anoxybacillus flavithermus]RWU12491.1 nucleotidyltransferase domain-containing protein [Anoxybacillus flavithermus]